MESIDLRLVFTIGAIVVALLGSWYTVKFGMADNAKKVDQLHDTAEAQWKKIDNMNTQIQIAEGKVKTMEKLLSVDKLQEFWIEDTRFKTSVDYRLQHLEGGE